MQTRCISYLFGVSKIAPASPLCACAGSVVPRAEPWHTLLQKSMSTPRNTQPRRQPAHHSTPRARERRAQHNQAGISICSLLRRVQVLCCLSPILWVTGNKSYFMPPRSPRSKAGSRNIEKSRHMLQSARKKHRKLVCVAVLNMDCVVCLDEQRSHIFGPCGHYCVCKECCETIMQSSKSCPICRSACTLSMRVFS